MTRKANINGNGKIVTSGQQKLEGNNNSKLKKVKDTALNSVNSLFKSSLIASILNFLKKKTFLMLFFYTISPYIESLWFLSKDLFIILFSFVGMPFRVYFQRGVFFWCAFPPTITVSFGAIFFFLFAVFVLKKHGFFLHSRKKRISQSGS